MTGAIGEHHPANLQEFTILTVCSGNLVRSPVAAQLLRATLRDAEVTFHALTVHSAGTIAREGDPMPAEAEELSRRFGGDPAGHRSRPLTAEHVAGANLILTATREHRAHVVSLIPRASRVAFSLTQFARLINALEPQEVAESGRVDTLPNGFALLAESAAARRGSLPLLRDPAEDDIADPYRQPQSAYDQAGAAIASAVEVIGAAFVGVMTEFATHHSRGEATYGA